MSAPFWVLLAAATLAGLLLRAHDLGSQSFWYDEAVTIGVSGHSLGHVFDALPDEASPPLYYVLAWGWMKVFGTGAEALRSLSVIAGVATIPVAFATARRLVSSPAALIAAALVAVNPLLVWYGQEGRNYALLSLAGAVTLLLCLRAAERPTRGRLAAWAASCCAALLVHYFAFFLIAPEAVLLLICLRERARPVLIALAPVAALGIALVPLAHAQAGGVDFINAIPIGHRLGDVGRELASANTALITESTHRPPGDRLWPGLVIIVIALGFLVSPTGARERPGAGIAAGFAACVVLVPAALSPTSLDFFFDRNLIAAWVPLMIVIGAACASARPRWLPALLAVGLCALAVRVDLEIASNSVYQREDWRTLVSSLGAADHPRAIFVQPAYAIAPLEAYGRDVEPIRPGTTVTEIDSIGHLGPADAPVAEIPGFDPPRVTRVPGMRLVRYRALRPVPITSALIAAEAGVATVLFEPGSTPEKRGR